MDDGQQDEALYDDTLMDITDSERKIIDSIYDYNVTENQELMRSKPWDRDKDYFKYCHISSVALLKMVLHTQTGGNLEVMGLMMGKVIDRSIVIMDAFELPVEGTETRVNAHEQAYEYMARYVEEYGKTRPEHVIGWYHSHPGYGCWLSGIDVNTQRHHQEYQDPFCAVVIDPKKTFSSGVVDIGAFRTYPRGNVDRNNSAMNTPTNLTSSMASSINNISSSSKKVIQKNSENKEDEEDLADLAAFLPSDKIQDFGVHKDEYYPMKVSFFKNKLDGAILEALSKKIGQSEMFSYKKVIENAVLTSNQVVNQIVKTRQVQKLLESGLAGGKGSQRSGKQISGQQSSGQSFGQNTNSEQNSQNYQNTNNIGSLSSIAMVHDTKSQMEMTFSRLDTISVELEKLRKTAGLITTDMLASYMPLKIKNELAERRGKEEIMGGDEDVTQPKKEEEESVIDVIMKNYHLIDPISSKYINDTKN